MYQVVHIYMDYTERERGGAVPVLRKLSFHGHKGWIEGNEKLWSLERKEKKTHSRKKKKRT